MLELPPEKQRLNYRGVQLGNDEITLGELGVEQDDQIELEFVSPVTPNQLKIKFDFESVNVLYCGGMTSMHGKLCGAIKPADCTWQMRASSPLSHLLLA